MARRKVDPDQIRALGVMMAKAVQSQPLLGPLYDTLLSIGGHAVAPRYEEDVEKLVDRGHVMSPKGLKMMEGDARACHSNSARLYESNPVEIVTGYGLSDHVWRQHSWVLWNGKVVETTVRREKYFGFVLTPEEAADFCSANP